MLLLALIHVFSVKISAQSHSISELFDLFHSYKLVRSHWNILAQFALSPMRVGFRGLGLEAHVLLKIRFLYK